MLKDHPPPLTEAALFHLAAASELTEWRLIAVKRSLSWEEDRGLLRPVLRDRVAARVFLCVMWGCNLR